MTLNEFIKEVVEGIKNYLPEEYEEAEINVVETHKNNIELSGLVIKKPDKNISPTIYLNSFYENYLCGRNLDDILEEISSIRVNFETEDFDVERITSFTNVKDTILPRLFSIEDNPIMKEQVYVPIEDTGLAVTFAAEVDMNCEDGVGCVPVGKGLAENWGVTAEELYELAFENMRKKNPPVLRGMNEVLFEMMKDELENKFGDEAKDVFEQMVPPTSMYVASNRNKLYGASVILDKDFMSKVQEEIGGNIVIIPSSVHEVLMVPQDDEFSYEELKAMVQEVNSKEVAPEERLSYELFTIHKNSLRKMSEEDFNLPVNLLD